MRIALDAGHGYRNGKPTGAQANGLTEDNLALTIVHKLRWYLLQAGCEVVLTRPDRAFVPLAVRGKIARARGCDMFVSVHINAAANREASGAEILVVESDTRSAALASKLLGAITTCGLESRGVKWDSQSQHSRLRVLRDTYRHMPAVLAEIGFLTSSIDAARLKDEAWLDKLAARVAAVIAGRSNADRNPRGTPNYDLRGTPAP